MAGNERQADLAATSKTRVQGVTTAQTVKSTPALVQRIIIANADVAVQTLTIADGATTYLVAQVPTKDTRVLELFAQFTTSLIVTPSSATIDALCFYD